MIEYSAQLGLRDAKLMGADDAAGTREEFTDFVRRHSRFVFRVAHAALRTTHDAEDVTQEVFLKLYRSGGWKNIDDEAAYLARAAWRTSVERLAKGKKNKTSSSDLSAELHSCESTPEEAMLQANWAATVRQLMDSLPEELRAPLVLSAINELKSAEIADILAIPEGTVRARVMKARQILREKLLRLGGKHER